MRITITRDEHALLLEAIRTEIDSVQWKREARGKYNAPLNNEQQLRAEEDERRTKLRILRDKIKEA